MRTSSILRIIGNGIGARGPREHYWRASRTLGLWRRLHKAGNRDFRRLVIGGYSDFLFSDRDPIAGETRVRIDAAARWLARGQDATPDDGVSLGYFPLDADNPSGWRRSYPETTGYIIQSLLEYAERYGAAEMCERAMRMSVWETQIQMKSGAVQGGELCDARDRKAAVFNTGMVLQGYTAALFAGAGEPIASGARRAADFLVADIGEDGHFSDHGPFVTQTSIKTYNVLCAWALQRYGAVTGDERYIDAATRVGEAAVRQQKANGWVADNCLDDADRPLTHTIGYTLQGLLETGLGIGRQDFVDAVVRGVAPLMDLISAKGFLYGRYHDDWRAGCLWSCLTGNAQLAIVAYRLFEVTGERDYLTFADRLCNFLKPLQALDSPNPALNGCLAGSYPILGSYMVGGYPNWATKYFLDALMLQDRLSGPEQSAKDHETELPAASPSATATLQEVE